MPRRRSLTAFIELFPQIAMSRNVEGYAQDVGYHKREVERRLKNDATTPVLERDYFMFYTDLLRFWFPQEEGWVVKQEPSGADRKTIPDFIVCVRLNSKSEPTNDWQVDKCRSVVVVELKRTAGNWSDAGRQQVRDQLEQYMEVEMNGEDLPVVWGIATVGFRWAAFRRRLLASKLETISDWKDDITSIPSWRAMRDFSNAVKQETFN